MSQLKSESFLHDVQNINWPETINIEKGDPNESLNSLEQTIDRLIDKHVPLKITSDVFTTL